MASRVKDQEYMDNFLKEYFLGLTQEQQVKLFQEFFYELQEQEMVGGLHNNQEDYNEELEEWGCVLTLRWAHSGDPLVG